MKNLIKAYFSAVTINNLLMAVFLYVLFFPPSPDDFLFANVGLGALIAVFVLVTVMQLIWLPLIGWPFFVMVTKKRRFSRLFCILLGLIIATSCSIIVMVRKGNFDMVEFIGFLLLGLFSGLVLALFYSLFNRQAKPQHDTSLSAAKMYPYGKRVAMVNLIKAYLITLLLLNCVYFCYFLSPYLRTIPYIYQGYIPSRFILDPMLNMLKITVDFVAFMFIIILPLFKLVTKYPNVSWIICFLAGFLAYFIIFLIYHITISNLWMQAFYENISSAVVFSNIFAALYWWFDRPKKRASKNLADEFR